MAEQSPSIKLQVQRRAAAFAAAVAAGDEPAWSAARSPEFAERDGELPPLFRRAERADLIGTVANRTLVHLHLDGGDTRVVELLWRDHDGAWLIDDARVFSLLADPG
ncbi:MAG TPA: hypothetical protein VKV34_08790 [Thermoleophilia bacterium]|nr:hypothetical protein [Thermoleophilia bacterium]